MVPIRIDLETTANGGPEGTSPEAHWKENRVLLCGWSTGPNVYIDTDTEILAHYIQSAIKGGVTPLLIAHNAKFDLKYLMRDNPNVEWHKCTVWDTMTFEYLDSGHLDKSMSLENACDKRGVAFRKSLDLDALLKSGVKMEHIPEADLRSYLKDDVEVLRFLYREQVATGNEYEMDHVMVLADIELKGLNVDPTGLEELFKDLTYDEGEAEHFAKEYIMDRCEWQDGSPVTAGDFTEMVSPKVRTIKPFANRTVSFLLFGQPATLGMGSSKWELKYKPGKYKPWTTIEWTRVGKYFEDTVATNLGYPVDESTLMAVCEAAGSTPTYAKTTLEYRKAHKITGTYLGPMTAQLKAGGVYPKYNPAVTSTGRLSSSEPNGQNMPEEVRRLVIAEDEHKIMEVDFSQLEMYTVAIESGDPDLLKDLYYGVDVHYLTAEAVFGAEQAEEKRKIAKNVNFGVLYGGKAGGLSKQTGVDRETIQQLIDAFFARYPRIKEWQTEFFEEVTNNMEPHDVLGGEQRYRATVRSRTTGRKFTFVEGEAPDWFRRRHHTKWCFSPNQTANYPIQGVAGGDVVMKVLTYVWKKMKELKYKSYIFATVHDSFVLQAHESEKAALPLIVEKALEHVHSKWKLPISLKVDIEIESTWQ